MSISTVTFAGVGGIIEINNQSDYSAELIEQKNNTMVLWDLPSFVQDHSQKYSIVEYNYIQENVAKSLYRIQCSDSVSDLLVVSADQKSFYPKVNFSLKSHHCVKVSPESGNADFRNNGKVTIGLHNLRNKPDEVS